MLKGNHQCENLTEFYSCLLSNEYTQLKLCVHGLMSAFAVPICVDIFKMKYIKCHYKSALTVEHL